ncbi:hypothetical protein R2A130_2613 [Ahrensia sp. R2A130]|nr:hypothetical protein R2A130_2613 [Ahrensia sp. R2A130]
MQAGMAKLKEAAIFINEQRRNVWESGFERLLICQFTEFKVSRN